MTQSACSAAWARAVVGLMAGVLLGAVPAWASPWCVDYEGDAFPEDQGWTRVHGSIPGERWIDNGVLFIQKQPNPPTYEFYEMTFDHPVDPQGPQETFLLRWRLKVDDVIGLDDPAVGVTSDSAGANEYYRASFGFSVDRVYSRFEHGVSAPIAPGVFHEYEMRSSDMRTYQLYVDSMLSMQGSFTEVFGPARVTFGQGVEGATSLAEWDYVRCAVVAPEPAGGVMGLLFVLGIWGRR